MLSRSDKQPIYTRVTSAPAYFEWADQKRDEGESEEILQRLESLGMWISPRKLKQLSRDDFDRMLIDLKFELRNTQTSDDPS